MRIQLTNIILKCSLTKNGKTNDIPPGHTNRHSVTITCLVLPNLSFSTSFKSILLFPWKPRSPTVINERPMGKKRIDIVKAWRLKFYNKFESYFTFQSISCFFSSYYRFFFYFADYVNCLYYKLIF